MENNDSKPFISVVIPNRNGEATIEACIGAATRQDYPHFEVVVIDDSSSDNSVALIEKYPCRLVKLDFHGGASTARNAGARAARGPALFFIDADCVMPQGILKEVSRQYLSHPEGVTGGTYSTESHDPGFFNRFQAVFVNYSETKHTQPDYVATHAMIISKSTFEESGGFDENFMPILEDVEFSHRLKTLGIRLFMQPELQVRHRFSFNLWRSLKNAFKKTHYWAMYSLKNKDLFADSGTASFEIKANTALWGLCALLLAGYGATGITRLLEGAMELYLLNLILNAKFLYAMARAHGVGFLIKGGLYYTLLYPAPIALGGLTGTLGHLKEKLWK